MGPLHPVTLRFRDENLERQFRVDVAGDTKRRSRIGVLLGLGAWLLVGPWTSLTSPEHSDIVWPIAYGAGVPLCALALGLT